MLVWSYRFFPAKLIMRSAKVSVFAGKQNTRSEWWGLTIAGVALLSLCVMTGTPVFAQQAPKVSSPDTVITTETDRDVDTPRAQAALAEGRDAKRRGDLLAAVRAYQVAFLYAADGSYIRTEARDELDFHLPLMRVQQVLVLGDRAEAITIVRRLRDFHAGNPERYQMLGGILANLERTDFNPKAAPAEPDARSTINEVGKVLEQFRAEHNRYPRGYQELNSVLPAGKAPLTDFEIARYAPVGSGFSLEIRSKKNPLRTYELNRTGLLR